MAKKIIVIGGGISGLATAALLAKEGHKVQLFEKNTQLGGRAQVWRKEGFVFDMGPSWYLMPEVFERFAGYFGKSVEDYYQLVRLDPHYSVHYENKSPLVIFDDLDKNVDLFNSVEPGSGEKLRAYLALLNKAYEHAMKLIYLDAYRVKSWLHIDRVQTLASFLTLYNHFQSWDSFVGAYFQDSRLKKILEFPAVFLGGSPYNTPALFALLSWADLQGGVWYPLGGMGKLIDMLEKIALEQSVVIEKGKAVDQIVVKNGKIVGVRVQNEVYACDAVAGATDLPHLETQLLSPNQQSYTESYWQGSTMGISALLMYLGIGKKLPGAQHHMLYFSDDWKSNFDEIFVNKVLPTKPSFYVSTPTVTDASIAPKNSEAMFVLAPIAGQSYGAQEWGAFAERILNVVESMVGEQFARDVIVKRVFGPEDFKYEYNAYTGTALGLAHTLSQSLWRRPGNTSKKISGLFYAGQYTNPGIGMPMAMISGELAARRIHEYLV